MQPEREVEVPPVVLLPVAQNVHTEFPVPGAYWLSYPHTVHVCWPTSEKVPVEHSVFDELPSGQKLPAGHLLQVFRVLPSALPPDVNMPIGHVSQMLAPASEYFLSSPQGTHAPPDSYVPAVHADGLPDDPHVEPFGHTSQVVRVEVVPPLVK